MEKSNPQIKQYNKGALDDKDEVPQKINKFENLYHELFYNSFSGMAYHKIIYDSDGKPINYLIKAVNPQYESVLLIKREDIINKTATKAYNVEKPPYLEIFSRVAETQKSFSFETYFQPMNKYFQITVISSEKGEFITVFDDISEKKKLIESEEKYRLITENANDLICILNKNYKFEFINEKTYLKVLGYSKTDLIGKSALKLNHPKDFESFVSSFWGKDEIDDRTVELRVKHKNGKWIWLNINIQRFNNEENEKKFLLVSREITFRKLAEQKIKESEEKYRHLFEDSPFAIALFNFEGQILECNSYVEQLLGFKKEELTGKDYKLLNLVPKEYRPSVLNGFKRLVEEDIPNPKRIQLYTKEGSLIWVLLHTSLIKLQEMKFIQVIVENITEMKKAEDALRESEARFRLLTEQNLLAISIIQDNKIVYANQALADLNEYSIQEMLDWKPNELTKAIYPEDIPFVLSQSEKKQRGDTHDVIPHYSYRKIMKDGRIKWVDLYSKTIHYNGKPADLVSQIDITEQKKMEEKLRESEENYRELVNDANSIILRWDIEGKINFINEFGESFFGYSKSGLVGKQVIGTIVPETETTGRDLEKLMENICKSPDIYKNNVNENITKYGRRVWISWTNKAIKDVDGTLIGILSVGNDITKQRIATLRISESEEKFRTITEQSFIGIAILQNFKFKYVNQQFADTLGYESKEILKWNPKEFIEFIHPDDRKRVMEIAEKKYFGKNEVLEDLQFRIIKKTGEIIWLEIISKTIPFEGDLADLIATSDITKKKEAEQIIIEENKALLELNKMRKDIITRVSHELKTPLTSIYGASQILLKHFDGKIGDEALNFIEILHRGALRLKKLVENLIDASRIESGKLELNLQRNDLVKITVECVEEMRYILESRKLSVELTYPNELDFNVDKLRLQQVITNILSNAIKNTPMEGKIYISIIDNHDFVDIKIRDTGIGITEKEKELLFEKFGKMERYGMDLGVDIEGSGLGLFISKEIVELHGGEIIVESEGRNKGSTFTIRLF
ncbi:MAG: PAS domain S-box protein [Candidatus Lokiarchaeota archaeon]|nr:PAS domain S-box protein [Candidatus Lokiarchaeota archaeon]